MATTMGRNCKHANDQAYFIKNYVSTAYVLAEDMKMRVPERRIQDAETGRYGFRSLRHQAVHSVTGVITASSPCLHCSNASAASRYFLRCVKGCKGVGGINRASERHMASDWRHGMGVSRSSCSQCAKTSSM